MLRKDHTKTGEVRYPNNCSATPEEWVRKFGWHAGTLVPRRLLRVERTVDDLGAIVSERCEAVLTTMPKGLPSAAPVSDWTSKPGEDDELAKSWDRLPSDQHESDQTPSVRDAEAQVSER